MKKRMILGAVALIVLGVTHVYAQSPGYSLGPGPNTGPRWGERTGSWKPYGGLNLTRKQKAKFQEIYQKLIEKNTQLIGAFVIKRLELWSLRTDPKSDPKAILDKEKELRGLQNQIRDKAIQAMLDAGNILTPEQLSEFGAAFGMSHGYGMGLNWQTDDQQSEGRNILTCPNKPQQNSKEQP